MVQDRHIAYTNRLLEVLNSWVPLSVSFRLALKEKIGIQPVAARQVILDPPEHVKGAWFSLDCFIVGYGPNNMGDVSVSRIYQPNHIFTDLPSFFQHKPSHLKLVIVDGSELLYFKKEDFDGFKEFTETFDLVQHLMFLEQEIEAWRGWLMTLRDGQKVREFGLRYPIYLLPNHICASFLQMTASRFSAEKANLARKA